MKDKDKKDLKDLPDPRPFQMNEEDLEAIAKAKSKVVPNIKRLGKTAFTIENAPVAKSIMRPINLELTPSGERHPSPVAQALKAKQSEDEQDKETSDDAKEPKNSDNPEEEP